MRGIGSWVLPRVPGRALEAVSVADVRILVTIASGVALGTFLRKGRSDRIDAKVRVAEAAEHLGIGPERALALREQVEGEG